ISARMVAVLVCVQDLGDHPSLVARCIEAQPPLERVHGQGFAGLGARYQIVKVAIAVSRPDPLYQHDRIFLKLGPRRCFAATYPGTWLRSIMSSSSGPG